MNENNELKKSVFLFGTCSGAPVYDAYLGSEALLSGLRDLWRKKKPAVAHGVDDQDAVLKFKREDVIEFLASFANEIESVERFGTHNSRLAVPAVIETVNKHPEVDWMIWVR